MKIIKPSYKILTPIDGKQILKNIELIGRISHKSESRITETSAAPFVKKLIELGDESVLEHESITVKFICDRGVSHELVRHRIAAYTQESTRYCNYSKDGFGNELTFIQPCFLHDMTEIHGNFMTIQDTDMPRDKYDLKDASWLTSMALAESLYIFQLNEGLKPEEARSILPNSLKTEIVCTANLREWRHVLSLRADRKAHPQMRELMVPLLYELQEKIPVVFDDIAEKIRIQNE